MQLNKFRYFKLFILVLTVIFISTSCQPPNLTNNKIENKTKNNLTFSTKALTPFSGFIESKYIPNTFNSTYCNCESESSVNLTYSARDYGEPNEQTFGGIQSLIIAQNGDVNIGVSNASGWLYGPTDTFTIVAKNVFPSEYSKYIVLPIETNGHPCSYGASHKGGPAAGAYISPTYYLRSGTVSLSIDNSDLVANVSGVTSDREAFWTAPWDSSCRIGEHSGQITSGSATVRFKNVIITDTLKLDISSTSLDESNPTSELKVTSSSDSRQWKLLVKKEASESCDEKIALDVTNSGNKTLNLSNADLLPGTYNVELYYLDDAENKVNTTIKSDNLFELNVNPETVVVGQEVSIDIKAKNRSWSLDIKEPSITVPEPSVSPSPIIEP
ncbi:MAG: hypothetical protein ACK4IX_13970, partial [Candidatus Sericytochromatia bacterium]